LPVLRIDTDQSPHEAFAAAKAGAIGLAIPAAGAAHRASVA
jgi:hypothetical protein